MGQRISGIFLHIGKNLLYLKNLFLNFRLAKYDIVITTYDLLVSEFKSGPVMIGQSSDESDSDESGQGTSKAKKKGKKKLPKHTDSVLAKIAWERVILDEAHGKLLNKFALG
jgi:SNF2 family DNA or RNA helicase